MEDTGKRNPRGPAKEGERDDNIAEAAARSKSSLMVLVDALPVGTHKKGSSVRQVLRLETKLRDIHATDTVANKRALETLHQHVQALHLESQVRQRSDRSHDADYTLDGRSFNGQIYAGYLGEY